jgi:hypothetical protein
LDTPPVVNTRDAHPTHPATTWLKALLLEKHDHILTEVRAALLFVKKPNRISSFSLVTPSPQDNRFFLGQGQHDLSTAVGIHIPHTSPMKCVATIMEKKIADHLGFDFIDEDITKGLADTSNNTQPVFKLSMVPTEEPKEPDKDDTMWVLTLVPVACTIAYGKTAPLGPIDSQEIKPLLQANHDTVFAWASAIQHSIENMGGTSFHHLATKSSTFDPFVPGTQRANLKARLASSVYIKPEVLTPDDQDYKLLIDRVTTAANHAKKAYTPASHGSSMDLISATTSAFTTLGDKVVINSGGTNSDHMMKNFNLAASFRLLCIGQDNTNDDWWVLPKAINPLLETLSKKGVSHGGTMLMNRSLKNFMNNLHDSKRDYTTSNSRAQTYNKPFWSHFGCTA